MRPVTLYSGDLQAAINELATASHENDLCEIAQNFSVGNEPAAGQRSFLGSNVQASTTGVGNGADTTEDVLYTFSLPANSLTVTGQTIEVFASGTLANNANNKTVRLYFGAQVYSLGLVATANVVWTAKLTVTRTGSSAQLISAQGMIGATPIAPALLTGAETDTAAITIKVTGQSGTAVANNIVAKTMTVSDHAADISNAFATWIADCKRGGLNRTT